MYDGKKVSVALATYREKKSIRKAINDFFKTGFVDEVVVVNNNAEAGTDEEIKKVADFINPLLGLFCYFIFHVNNTFVFT